MGPTTLASAFALAFIAGCASAPPPAPKTALPGDLAGNTSLASAPAVEQAPPPPDGDVEFTVSPVKAKEAKPDVGPATTLKYDSASSGDVKSVHLHAAADH